MRSAEKPVHRSRSVLVKFPSQSFIAGFLAGGIIGAAATIVLLVATGPDWRDRCVRAEVDAEAGSYIVYAIERFHEREKRWPKDVREIAKTGLEFDVAEWSLSAWGENRWVLSHERSGVRYLHPDGDTYHWTLQVGRDTEFDFFVSQQFVALDFEGND